MRKKEVICLSIKNDYDTCRKFNYHSNCINELMFDDIKRSLLQRVYNLNIGIIRAMYPFFEIRIYSSIEFVPDQIAYDLGTIIITYDENEDRECINDFLFNMFPVV